MAFTVLLIVAFFLSRWLGGIFPHQYKYIQIGLMILVLWLVITATMRSLVSLNKKVYWWQLLINAFFVTVLGMVGYMLFLFIYAVTVLKDAMNPFDWQLIAFFTALGTVLSVLSLINLKIRNRFWGNVLEGIVVLAIIAGIILVLRL